LASGPGKRAISDPDLPDRLYELLEHDHPPYSAGSRFVRLIVALIVVDVLAAILASVPELDASFDRLFTSIEIAAALAFALEYAARVWSVAGHSLRHVSPTRARLEYMVSSLGIIDLLAFLPSAIALIIGDKTALVLFGMLPFLKLVRYSPAMRSLLSVIHAERRTLFGCLVILSAAVLLFASLLYAIEHNVQPDKFGTIPQAMWWAIVTLGTVGYGDVVPATPLGKLVSVFAIVVGFAMIALPVAIISTPLPTRSGGATSSLPGACWRGCRCSHIFPPPNRRHHEAAEGPYHRGQRDSGAAGRCRLVVYFITTGEVEIGADPARPARRRHLSARIGAAPDQAQRHRNGDAPDPPVVLDARISALISACRRLRPVHRPRRRGSPIRRPCGRRTRTGGNQRPLTRLAQPAQEHVIGGIGRAFEAPRRRSSRRACRHGY
jgi:voltage-gated potassium channel Kch